VIVDYFIQNVLALDEQTFQRDVLQGGLYKNERGDGKPVRAITSTGDDVSSGRTFLLEKLSEFVRAKLNRHNYGDGHDSGDDDDEAAAMDDDDENGKNSITYAYTKHDFLLKKAAVSVEKVWGQEAPELAAVGGFSHEVPLRAECTTARHVEDAMLSLGVDPTVIGLFREGGYHNRDKSVTHFAHFVACLQKQRHTLMVSKRRKLDAKWG
jgi:hypothetical protein